MATLILNSKIFNGQHQFFICHKIIFNSLYNNLNSENGLWQHYPLHEVDPKQKALLTCVENIRDPQEQGYFCRQSNTNRLRDRNLTYSYTCWNGHFIQLFIKRFYRYCNDTKPLINFILASLSWFHLPIILSATMAVFIHQTNHEYLRQGQGHIHDTPVGKYKNNYAFANC